MFSRTPFGTQEKTYCKVGAFKNVNISRKDLNIPPQDFRTMANATKLTLYLANQAINHAGIVDSDIPRERIGILISREFGGVGQHPGGPVYRRDGPKRSSIPAAAC